MCTGCRSKKKPTSWTRPDYDGWLTKQGAKRKTWKKRWFELTETHLRYYTAPHGEKNCEEKGLIVLQGRPPPCPSSGERHQHAFDIPGASRGGVAGMKEGKDDAAEKTAVDLAFSGGPALSAIPLKVSSHTMIAETWVALV